MPQSRRNATTLNTVFRYCTDVPDQWLDGISCLDETVMTGMQGKKKLTSPDDRAGEIDTSLWACVTITLVTVTNTVDVSEHPQQHAVWYLSQW